MREPNHEPGPGAEGGAVSPAGVGVANDAIVRQFVEHWGMMARSWGINSTMGELFALLYVTGTDWTADALREWLRVSRGNVSMNLRELMAWGVVQKVHRQGERREFFRVEADVWNLFRRILGERKRRELDPTVQMLKQCVVRATDAPGRGVIHARVSSLQQFFALMNTVSTRLLTLDAGDLDNLKDLFESHDEDAETGPFPENS